MKETVKINLAQRLFDLDSDAYERLKNYLDTLNKYFNKTSDNAEDVLNDIEHRIAELLLEKLSDKKQVINLPDIEQIIEQMGTVEDFARETDAEGSSDTEQEDQDTSYRYGKDHSGRKLFRDTEHSIIGGVSGGVAAYFGVDTVWIRLAFIALFFLNLFGLLLYVMLWAIVPAAHTTAERLQMKGRPVNVENIQQSVKDEFGKVKENFNRFSKSDSYKNMHRSLADIVDIVIRICIVSLKVVLIIIGIGFALAGLSLLVAFISAMAAGTAWSGWNWPGFNLPNHFIPYINNISLLGLAVFIVIIVPVISIISAFIRFVFNIKRHNRVAPAFAWTLWVLALVFVVMSLVSGEHKLGFSQQYSDKATVEIDSTNTLYITVHEKSTNYRNQRHYSVFGKDVIKERWTDNVYLEPELVLLPSYSGTTYVEIEYRSVVPWEHSQWFQPLVWSFADSVLTLEQYWQVDEDNLWRIPGAYVKLYIPTNQKIFLQNELRNIPAKTSNTTHIPDEYFNKALVMNSNQLTEAID